jgi:ribosome-interacting GTPase 1
MKRVKLFEAFVNEGKSVLDLTKVQKEITKKCKEVDGVEITKGNKLTGIKELEIKSDWITSLKVKSDGDIYTDDSLSAVGGSVKSESELYKFVNSIIQQEIDYHKQTTESFVNEGKLTKKDFDKVVKAVEKSKQPVTVLLNTKWDEVEIIVGYNAPDSITDAIWPHTDKLSFNDKITIAGDSSTLSRREYDEIARVNGGHKRY